MKSLIVIGHPEENSFCYNGIFKTILKELKENMYKSRLRYDWSNIADTWIKNFIE